MTETYLVTKGGEKHKWNGKIAGRKIVRLDCKKVDGADVPINGEINIPITPPNITLHLHSRTPSKLNDAGNFQWLEGLIFAHKHGYDRIKVAKLKYQELCTPPSGLFDRIVKAIAEKEMK